MKRPVDRRHFVKTTVAFGAGIGLGGWKVGDVSAAAVGMSFKTLFELKRYLRPEDFERMAPYLTVNSFRDTANGWLSGVTLGGFSSGSQGFSVGSVAGFSASRRRKKKP